MKEKYIIPQIKIFSTQPSSAILMSSGNPPEPLQQAPTRGAKAKQLYC